MVGVLYFIVILISTCIGAIAGMGGGVIIKPVLDVINIHNVETISFLSCCAVLTMSLISTWKSVRSKTTFDVTLVLLTSLGSVFGGLLGSYLFKQLLLLFPSSSVKGIQAIILIILLLFVLCNSVFHFKTYQVKHHYLIIFIGCILGIVSSFLGIGGGPFNVAVFVIFFSFSLKQAIVYSLTTIVFAQVSSLCTIAFTSGFAMFDLRLLWYVLPAAVLGALFGGIINKKLDHKQTTYTFNATVCLIIVIAAWNAYCAFH